MQKALLSLFRFISYRSTQLNSSLIRTVAWEAKRNTEMKDT